MKNYSDEKTLIVARCQDSINAHLIQGRLESEGIASIIHNEFRAYDIGTVEVLVYAKDYGRDYQIIHNTTPEFTSEEIVCPFCGSTDIAPVPRYKTQLINGLTILLSLIGSIFIPKAPLAKYRCNKCNSQFEKKSSRR